MRKPEARYLYKDLSMYLSIYLCIYLSVYLSIYVCIYLSMYVSIYLSIYGSTSLVDLGRFFSFLILYTFVKSPTFTQPNTNTE
jgi:sensor histidine kinase YesM